MDDVGVMEVEDRLGQLVNDVLFMSLLQMLVIIILSYQRVQVDIHVLKHQINVLVVLCSDDVIQTDYIAVL